MSDLTIQLLRLINEGKTLNEISEILNISHKKIFNYLTMIKNTGYDFKRNYYSNGDIIYTPEVRYNVPASNEVNLLMSQNDETLRAVVIHDISPLKVYGQNLMTILNNYRHDLVTIGYCEGLINVKNEAIVLSHPIY